MSIESQIENLSSNEARKELGKSKKEIIVVKILGAGSGITEMFLIAVDAATSKNFNLINDLPSAAGVIVFDCLCLAASNMIGYRIGLLNSRIHALENPNINN